MNIPASVDPLPEEQESLWLLIVAPATWAGHFMLCYVTVAIWCAKVAGRDGSLGPVHVAIAGYTVLALVGIGLVGRIGYRRYRFAGATTPDDFDSAAGRQRFLGLANLLLSALSLVATLYSTLAAVFIRSCH